MSLQHPLQNPLQYPCSHTPHTPLHCVCRGVWGESLKARKDPLMAKFIEVAKRDEFGLSAVNVELVIGVSPSANGIILHLINGETALVDGITAFEFLEMHGGDDAD